MQIAPKVYIAQTTLRTAGPDGLPKTIVAGERIDDFASWPYDNQVCLLHLGQVKELGGRHRANLSVEGGYLHYEAQGQSFALPVAAPHSDPSVGPAVPAVPAAQPSVSMPPDALVPVDSGAPKDVRKTAAVGRITVVCPDCQKVCNGHRGLILHRAKSHAELL